MRIKLTLLLIISLLCAATIRAEENPSGDDDKKRAAALVKDLGADDFEIRENAEKALKLLGVSAMPAVKDAAGNSSDAEVRLRCDRILKVLALETDSDPEHLAAMAKSEAEARRFADAGKLYAKAGKLFKEQAEKSADDKAKKDLLGKSAKALARQQRADALAKAELSGADAGGQIMVNGGRIRIRQQIVMNGGVVIQGEAADGSDW